MFEGHDQAIYELLAAQGRVTTVALKRAFDGLPASRRSFARVVIDLGLVDTPTLLCAVADYVGGEYCADLPDTLQSEVAALLDASLARRFGVVPLYGNNGHLTLAAVDPINPQLVPDLSFALDREIRVAVADPGDVETLIRRHYGDEPVSLDEVLGDLPALEASVDAMLSESAIEELAGQTSIIRYVNLILSRAIRDLASDLHFEPFEDEFRIRYRLDGVLHELPAPSCLLAIPVISRLKVLANLDIAERRLPQDGRIRLTMDGRAVDLRVSTLPTQFGESLVLRVLDQSAERLDLGQLGLPPFIRRTMEGLIHRPNGIVMVTGPTGSGKTTTLYSCLKLLNTANSKLLTVEDPVEYEIEGIMQVPVNLAAGLTFASALRTFLRQDPDIVMVGEIRDLETAQIAIQAALTGHLVLTTLHTNDAPSAVTRLVDMGIEPFLLASTVEAVLAQRLLRRICPDCRIATEPIQSLLGELGLDPGAQTGRSLYRGRGCERCHHTGYRGRLGVFEFLSLTDPLREMIVSGASLVELRRQAVASGMVTLREAALTAAFSGATTVEEVLKYT